MCTATVPTAVVCPQTVLRGRHFSYCRYVGPNFHFSDAASVCSGGWPSDYGYAVEFDGLTAGAQGQGYTDSACTDNLFTADGPGTVCWKSGGSARAASVNWVESGSKSSTEGAKQAIDCAAPLSFNYVDPSGQSKSIKVGSSEAAEAIAAAYEQGDFNTLGSYPTCELHILPTNTVTAYLRPWCSSDVKTA